MFPDGRRVECLRRATRSKVWDVATGKCVATLEGHSNTVHCGVHCTFVMMCLRCRSWRCGVSGRAARAVSGSNDRHSRCGAVATGECVAALEGHSDWVRCGVRPFRDDVCVVGLVRCRVSGRAARRVWLERQDTPGDEDVATGEWVATLEGHSGSVRRRKRPLYFVMIWLRRELCCALRCLRTGGASCLAPNDNTLKVWDVATGEECVAAAEGHSREVRCSVRHAFVMMCLRRRSRALPCFRTGGA